MNETIVIADDNPDNLEVLCGLLKAAGYTVHPSNDGAMALQALQHLNADLILLDIRMPDMDGYQVCEALKKDPATRDIPVIFISALHESLDKFKAFNVGGVDYICKPFDQEEVLARVSTHVQLYRLQKARLRYAEELELEVERKTAALREANTGLEKALHTKEDFLGLISHELRTPLNCILGFTQLLRSCSEEEREKFLNMLETSGLRLLQLLENLVQLTALGYAPKTDEQSDPINIEQLCTESLKIIADVAEKNHLTLHLEIDSCARLDMPLSAARMRQILVNLLDNAVKFTPPAGDIGLKVRGDPAEQMIYFQIWDNGPGIPAADQENIFEPFVQVEPLFTRHHEGAGLGLALTRNLLNLHQGKIYFIEREGGGSIFEVYLTAKPVTAEGQTDMCRVSRIWSESGGEIAAGVHISA